MAVRQPAAERPRPILLVQPRQHGDRMVSIRRHGKTDYPTGDVTEPPYRTGLAALRDCWRLFQVSQLTRACTGTEYDTSYLRHEFFFERLSSCS
jgi:hypothetical protein